MSGKPSIGVIAISKNEEEDIQGFIDCLVSWVDEIIIVDDGSTDRTKQIAEKACSIVKIIDSPMSEEQGFAGQRNIGIQHASSDWLLHMDIDERVTPAFRAEIMNAISLPDVIGCRYKRLNFFLHRPMRGGGLERWNMVQLAKREHAVFVNKVHEALKLYHSAGKVIQLKEKMWHLNDSSYLERMRKSDQYCVMGAERLIASNKRVKAYRLLTRPVIRFIVTYVLFKGFLDGVPGLIWAMHSSIAEFRIIALGWDHQNRISRTQLEKAALAD